MVRVAVVPSLIDVSPVGVNTKVPGVLGVSVMLMLHLAPIGMDRPAITKLLPTLKLVALHGAPTE
jgi:hypothetical protein